MTRDTLYAEPIAEISDFVFDEQVAAVFQDMVQRSVPGYQTIISAIGLLANRFAQPESRCYDLGCSLGAATQSMRHTIQQPGCEIIAVDNAPAMIDRCRKTIAPNQETVPVEFICSDIRDLPIENCSVAILNFTLQFLPLPDRSSFLARVYEGMLPKGILVLSEKLKFADATQQALLTDLHHAFKAAQGYSELEISQKRTSLESVLIPETLDAHKKRLSEIGFRSIEVWFQQFNFASLIAFK